MLVPQSAVYVIGYNLLKHLQRESQSEFYVFVLIVSFIYVQIDKWVTFHGGWSAAN